MNPLEAIELHLALHNIRHAESLRDGIEDLLQIRKANILIRNTRYLDPIERRAQVQVPVVILDDGIGALVGLSFGIDEPPDRRLDRSLLDALDSGVQAAWNLLQHDSALPPPALLPRFELDASVQHKLGGQSAGLAAAVAAFGAMTGRSPDRPVIASGEIDASGTLVAAGYLKPKLEAASREGWKETLVLVAGKAPEPFPAGLDVHPVDSVAKAIELAYGTGTLYAGLARGFLDGSASFIALENLIADGQFERVVEIGERIADKMKPGIHALKARWMVARASVHLGTDGANRMYEGIEEEIRRQVEDRVLSHDDWARFVADSTVALIDQMEHEEAVRRLREALRNGIDSRRITKSAEIHLRGTLAMALAQQGLNREAVEERRRNLEIHDAEAAGQSTRARTLCNLAWELYRATGNVKKCFARLDQADDIANTKRDAFQSLYNLYARVRILLWEKDPDEVTKRINQAARNSEMIKKIDGYPSCCIELVRCAALVMTGQHREAINNLERLRGVHMIASRPRRGLLGWLVHLGLGWEIEAHAALGDTGGVRVKAAIALDLLGSDSPRCLHLPSSRRFSANASIPEDPYKAGKIIRSWHRNSWY